MQRATAAPHWPRPKAPTYKIEPRLQHASGPSFTLELDSYPTLAGSEIALFLHTNKDDGIEINFGRAAWIRNLSNDPCPPPH